MGSLEYDDCGGQRRRRVHQEEDPGHAGADVRYSALPVLDGSLYQAEQVAIFPFHRIDIYSELGITENRTTFMCITREAGHSIECITHASHSIAFLHFVTLWPDIWPFDLILIFGRGLVMDYWSAKFGDFNASRFYFIVQTNRNLPTIGPTPLIVLPSRTQDCSMDFFTFFPLSFYVGTWVD